MIRADSLRSLAFVLAAPLLAQAPELHIGFAPYQVTVDVANDTYPFVGIVLVSLSPNLQHSFTGLPPLLADAIVLDWGVSQESTYHTAVSEFLFPPGVFLHVQGVTISDLGILSSRVEQFVLDATAPPR